MGTHAAQLLLHQSTDNDPVCGKTTSSPYPTYAAPPAGPERAAEGIFAFVDGSHSARTAFGAGQEDTMPRVNANSFYVRAHGGVRFATGIVPRGAAKAPLEMGVQIPAKGSCWSVLSDRNAKTNVSKVDDAWVLNALAKVPVSTWQYAGGPEGGGEDGRGVTHMGPMAQDFNEALWPLLGNTDENETLAERGEDEGARILTSDADGALMESAERLAAIGKAAFVARVRRCTPGRVAGRGARADLIRTAPGKPRLPLALVQIFPVVQRLELIIKIEDAPPQII